MALPDPRPVLDDFLPLESIRSIEPLGSAGGWSGSLLWRITAEEFGAGLPTSPQDYCLRRWPESTSRDRLTFIHQILTHVAAQGVDFIPVPIPTRRASEGAFIQIDRHLWDLTSWLPGTADYHANPSRPRLSAALQALARFHTAAATFPPNLPVTGTAPAFTERFDLVWQLLDSDLNRIQAAVHQGLDVDLDLRAEQILSRSRGLLPQLLAPLEVACRQPLSLSSAIRDIHHDHVLFTGERVTGLIDFGALRIDTPFADVARLVGSLVADDQPARDFALTAYAELRPLDDADRRLIDLLDHSGLVLGGLNWLRWLYLDRRDMGPLRPIVKRLDAILARLLDNG